MTFCKQCGLLVPQGSRFCPRCGAAVPPAPLCPVYAPDSARDTASHTAGRDAEFSGSVKYAHSEPPEMPTWRYLVTLLLFAIPAVGLVLMVVLSFARGKYPERQRLARACLIKRLIIDLILPLIAILLFLFVNSATYSVMYMTRPF
ncbi:MAG: zinc ribbon domain-containing protein [Oscillospiraceae bacterium]|nr:zinc ribbon domain-containing protein [Oscillospiraceae bacterium]